MLDVDSFASLLPILSYFFLFKLFFIIWVIVLVKLKVMRDCVA